MYQLPGIFVSYEELFIMCLLQFLAQIFGIFGGVFSAENRRLLQSAKRVKATILYNPQISPINGQIIPNQLINNTKVTYKQLPAG